MKIIVYDSNEELYVMPDTTLLRNNEPYFEPNFETEGEEIVEGISVKITRLAKSLQPKFAHRTWEEWFESKDHRVGGVHHTIGRCYDRSFEVSPEIHPKSELTEERCQEIDEIIAHITNYIGLRIGDYIFIPNSAK